VVAAVATEVTAAIVFLTVLLLSVVPVAVNAAFADAVTIQLWHLVPLQETFVLGLVVLGLVAASRERDSSA
jgi:hypothetical protein